MNSSLNTRKGRRDFFSCKATQAWRLLSLRSQLCDNFPWSVYGSSSGNQNISIRIIVGRLTVASETFEKKDCSLRESEKKKKRRRRRKRKRKRKKKKKRKRKRKRKKKKKRKRKRNRKKNGWNNGLKMKKKKGADMEILWNSRKPGRRKGERRDTCWSQSLVGKCFLHAVTISRGSLRCGWA